MKTLEQLRNEKTEWTVKTEQKQIEFDTHKRWYKRAIEDLKTGKKLKNRSERELKFAKKMVEKLDKRIRAMPGNARRWGREHPGEVWNNIEGGKYN